MSKSKKLQGKAYKALTKMLKSNKKRVRLAAAQMILSYTRD